MKRDIKITSTRTFKEIKGRKIEMFAYEPPFEKEIVPSGSGAVVYLPRDSIGKKARVQVVFPKPFICLVCHKLRDTEEHYSEVEDICSSCVTKEQIYNKADMEAAKKIGL